MAVGEQKCYQTGLCEKGSLLVAKHGYSETDAFSICIQGCASAKTFAKGFSDALGSETVEGFTCGIEAELAFDQEIERQDLDYA